MRLAKIKNKYLYKDDNPEGIHTYALYYDKPSKCYRAVGLTHLYVKDKKRFIQIKQGKIHIEKFKEFDVPSGVRNHYYDKNVDGKKIDILDRNNIVVGQRYLTKKQSERIKRFATHSENWQEQKKKSRR